MDYITLLLTLAEEYQGVSMSTFFPEGISLGNSINALIADIQR